MYKKPRPVRLNKKRELYVFTKNGAKIESSKDMGSRELAYEINKFKTGYYYLYEISSKDNKASKEFTRLANLSEDIIRHITIKL